MMMFLLLLVLLLVLDGLAGKSTSAGDYSITYLTKPEVAKSIQLGRGDKHFFCVKGTPELTPASWFYHTSILVKSNEPMGNFMVLQVPFSFCTSLYHIISYHIVL